MRKLCMTTVKEIGFVSCPVVMSLDYTSQFDKKLTNGSHWVGLEPTSPTCGLKYSHNKAELNYWS